GNQSSSGAAVDRALHSERELPAIDVPSRLKTKLDTVRPYLTYFNSRATASDPIGARTKGAPQPREPLGNIVHTVAQDSEMLELTLDELESRGFRADGGHHLVVVAEWDTVYGRRLPELLREAVGSKASPERVPSVITYRYLRGLDGSLPGRVEGASGKTRAESGGEEEAIERSEGGSQFDYVRRLTDSLAENEARLRAEGSRLFAIGVLGSDVYDKLLILQALRERFPHALFFTTSLDTRLFHGPQRDWNRNLLVSSSFGLELSRPLQGELPPFRDSYQTATFVATRLAIGGLTHRPASTASEGVQAAAATGQAYIPWRAARHVTPRGAPVGQFVLRGNFPAAKRRGKLGSSRVVKAAEATGLTLSDAFRAEPQLFEIGRRAIVPLLQSPSERSAARGNRLLAGLYAADRIPVAALNTTLLMLVLAGGVLIWSSRRLQFAVLPRRLRLIALQGAPDNPLNRLAAWGALPFLVTVLALVVLLSFEGHFAEPFFFLQGVSAWPTVLLRMLTVCTALVLVLWGHVRLSSSAKDVATLIDVRPPTPRSGSLRREFHRLLRYGSPTSRELVPRLIMWSVRQSVSFWRPREQEQSSVNGEAIWQEYGRRGRWSRRLMRSLLPAVVFCALAMFLQELADPISPHVRGGIAQLVDRASFIVTAFTACLVVFLVVDATRLFERLVNLLTADGSGWSSKAQRHGSERTGLPEDCVAELLDIEVIEREGIAVANLVLFPFAILALSMVARNSYFDRWPWTPALIFSVGLLILLVLTAATLLRASAERARQRKLKQLDGLEADVRRKSRQRVLVSATQEEAFSPQRERLAELALKAVERTRELVESRRRGVFTPYQKSPILQAILLPFGGAGFIALLDWLAMAAT
ncbi:MAG: hypothetical protein AAFZ65_06225, partial [Planctomycetota bacterium]